MTNLPYKWKRKFLSKKDSCIKKMIGGKHPIAVDGKSRKKRLSCNVLQRLFVLFDADTQCGSNSTCGVSLIYKFIFNVDELEPFTVPSILICFLMSRW